MIKALWFRIARYYREEMRLLDEHRRRMDERFRRRDEWQKKARKP